ncbi:hypothetical protein ACR03S_06085 [Limimaricola variabilis]|uniref:hypothetical protein n=1 Tax=Limimaricola variabilis TaxID=1492771 RepID=UPI002AC96D68|nr:hypothetical protein [Limimaricola variabilis]WPY94894.1 hypothetical protein T8T21_01840 [Limimaricola variabilis]
MSSVETLAYFLEEDALRGVMRDWPAGMQLMVRLDGSGRCELVVHHRDEAARVLETLREGLGEAVDTLAVVPEVEGYATRRVRFSEEQQLLALAASADGLSESAQDYAINYRFAREEGLDPETVIGRDARRFADEIESDLPQVSERRVARRNAAPAEPRLFPEGFEAADDPARRECALVTAHLHGQGARVRLTLEPEALAPGAAELPVTVENVGHSEDFGCFVLPRGALAGWEPGLPLVIDMPQAQFPEAWAARFRRQTHHAQVSITARGVFVRPQLPAPEAPAEAPMVEVQEGWRLGRPLRAALLVAGMLAVGGSLLVGWNPGATTEHSAAPLQPARSGLAALTNAGEVAR